MVGYLLGVSFLCSRQLTTDEHRYTQIKAGYVTPAQAGVQWNVQASTECHWIPACAGMTQYQICLYLCSSVVKQCLGRGGERNGGGGQGNPCRGCDTAFV